MCHQLLLPQQSSSIHNGAPSTPARDESSGTSWIPPSLADLLPSVSCSAFPHAVASPLWRCKSSRTRGHPDGRAPPAPSTSHSSLVFVIVARSPILRHVGSILVALSARYSTKCSSPHASWSTCGGF
jgi:hypothetical protein